LDAAISQRDTEYYLSEKKGPMFQLPVPKAHHRMTEIYGLTLQQPFFKQVKLRQTIMKNRLWGDQQLSHPELSCMSYETFLAVELLL